MLEAPRFPNNTSTNESLLTDHGSDAKPRSPRRRRKIPPLVSRIVAGTVLTALGAIAAAPVCGGGEEEEPQTPEPTRVEKRDENLSLPWADTETWYLSGGPHRSGRSQIFNGVDFLTDIRVVCPGGQPIENRFVRASAPGRVIVSGNENDGTDPNHSIVKIQHEDGLITGYMHLANIKAKVGQSVQEGDVLGNPSCENPAGGSTEGAHLHFFLEGPNGPIPIDDIFLSIWRIDQGNAEYEGTMNNISLAKRTADRRRCGPNPESIRSCGGIRNDISSGSYEGFRIERTPMSPPAQLSPPNENRENQEFIYSEEAQVDMGNWQLAVLGWEREDSRKYLQYAGGPEVEEIREGWDYLTIRARIKNINAPFVNNGQASDSSNDFSFSLQTPRAPYESELRDFDPLNFQVPAGFSYPKEIGFWIPKNIAEYSLVVKSKPNNQIIDSVQKNHIVRNFEAIDQNIPLLHPSQEWTIADFASVRIASLLRVENSQPDLINNWLEENVAQFQITNNYVQNIPLAYHKDFKVLVFARNGKVIEGKEIIFGEPVAPNLAKNVDVKFGPSGTLYYQLDKNNPADRFGEIFPREGAIVVAIMQDQWGAWQMP